MIDKPRINRSYHRMKNIINNKSILASPKKEALQESLMAATIEIMRLKRELANREREVHVLTNNVRAIASAGAQELNAEVKASLNYLKESLEKVEGMLEIVHVNKGTLGIDFMMEHNRAILRGVGTLENLLLIESNESITQSSPRMEEHETSGGRERGNRNKEGNKEDPENH